MDRVTARRVNRAHWDAMAAAHGQDAYYDTEALIGGADTLHEAEQAGVREAVGAVAGLDVLHLQCHIGFDAISLARRGARVVGADFSPASLEKARALARRCDVKVEFVEADATKLPVELHNRFDLVYATIGVIGWIDDLGAWMRSAASALRGGGKLLLVDLHPVYSMFGRSTRCGSTSRTRTTARAASTSPAPTQAPTSTWPPPRRSSTAIRWPRSSTRRWAPA
jgi:SAM-dependent methyltransferase